MLTELLSKLGYIPKEDLDKVVRNKPELSRKHKSQGLVWELRWTLVCDTCGGNCGQCGNTNAVGNIGFSMERIASKIREV